MPYQIEGAKFLAARTRAMLADEQGLGKTAQAIRACDIIMAEHVAVVCPASLVENWRREFRRWSKADRSVYVFSYEGAVKAIESKESRMIEEADVVILDEAHYLKTPGTQRSRLVYPAASRRPYVWALSGTPIPNHAGEMYTHFKYLAPDRISTPQGSLWTEGGFLERYCVLRETNYGRKPIALRNSDELKAKLDGWFLRRTKKDIELQLPPIRYGTITLRATKEQYDVSREIADKTTWQQWIDEDRLPADDEHMASARKMLAGAKVDALSKILADELESDQSYKVVVYGWHVDALKALAHNLRSCNPVVVTGETPLPARQAAVDAFQTDRNTRVFIGQIKAAGTGLTLTAASNLVFLELAWTPGDNAQAAMRVHRIGQTAESVLIRFVELAGTLDEAVVSVLSRKTRDIAQILD
jgi:SNF2 family DNA or RNA helicase